MDNSSENIIIEVSVNYSLDKNHLDGMLADAILKAIAKYKSIFSHGSDLAPSLEDLSVTSELATDVIVYQLSRAAACLDGAKEVADALDIGTEIDVLIAVLDRVKAFGRKSIKEKYAQPGDQI